MSIMYDVLSLNYDILPKGNYKDIYVKHVINA